LTVHAQAGPSRPPIPALVLPAVYRGMLRHRLGLSQSRGGPRDWHKLSKSGRMAGCPVPSGCSDLEAAYAEWSGRGVSILRELADMDFGRTFVVLDPDGHRLRVFAPV
jgi:hypothetical protein